MRPEAKAVKGVAEPPIALTIAGFDPSSGAGTTADLQVFADHGVQGVSALTALTVQSTRRVLRVQPVEAHLLRETLDLLAEDLLADGLPLAGVKIGMLATADTVMEVSRWLRDSPVPRERVVLDPVLRSSSGAALLEPEGVRRVSAELLKRVGWVTPNIDELSALTGGAMTRREAVPRLAAKLAELGAEADSGLNVVVTGGHLEPPDDFLRTAAGEEEWFPGQRVEARSFHGTHGTGCAFSSALLCRILLGDGPVEAVAGAKAWVVRRLRGGSRQRVITASDSEATKPSVSDRRPV